VTFDTPVAVGLAASATIALLSACGSVNARVARKQRLFEAWRGDGNWVAARFHTARHASNAQTLPMLPKFRALDNRSPNRPQMAAKRWGRATRCGAVARPPRATDPLTALPDMAGPFGQSCRSQRR
jgi:hypothetical protein